MTAYSAEGFRPPAPVAAVVVRSPSTGASIANVSMLLDTGADVSFLPRDIVAELIDTAEQSVEYEVESFDGTKSLASVAKLEVKFLGKSLRGQFLLMESNCGVLGRNILNSVALLLDGPRLSWNEHR